jgi:hypothetical protein
MELNIENPPVKWIAWVHMSDRVNVHLNEVKVLNETDRVVLDQFGKIRTLYGFELEFSGRKSAAIWIAGELNRIADEIAKQADQYIHLASAVEIVNTETGVEVQG